MRIHLYFRRERPGRSWSIAFLALVGLCIASSATAQLVISEFRWRGPGGASDEYIEILNNSGAPLTVAASSGGGFGIAASDGVTRCTIPNGTMIGAGRHYLCTNSVGYSLSAYLAGNGTTATGDATFVTDIPDNTGIALFNNNTGGGSYSLANRLDAVGAAAEPDPVYKEGTGLPSLSTLAFEAAFYRDNCGKQGSISTFGPCPSGGVVVDTNDNATNFVYVNTDGTSDGAGQRLGAPGPENLSSPLSGTAAFTVHPLDSTVGNLAAPNFFRDSTPDPVNNSPLGALHIRRRFVNATGGSVTRLRFRIIDLSTFPVPSGVADLRSRSSTNVTAVSDDSATCAPSTPPCSVTALGTTLELPPAQPSGGAFNSSLAAGTVTLGTPLATGASINLQFLFGVVQTGTFKLGLLVEGLPNGGGLFEISGCTDTCVPAVTAIVRADPNPTFAQTVSYTVNFNESVTGVDVSDFTLTTSGTIAGATVTNVSGSGAVYTVTADRGTGTGTLRLDLVDDDSIINGASTPLGGAGAGNGSFNSGQAYTITTAPVTLFSGPSATGTGTVTASFTGGGAGCTFTSAQLIGAPPGAPPVPPVGVPNVTFLHGLFTFSLGQCTQGSTVAFTIVYPQALALGTQYWKYGPTSGDPTNHWYVLPAAVAGNTVTFSLTDGGLGDDDLTPNGTIVDQGGPGTPNGSVIEIPTLDGKGLAILVGLLLAMGILVLRRT